MKCLICGGDMYTYTFTEHGVKLDMWCCLICGDVIDEVLLINRQYSIEHPTHESRVGEILLENGSLCQIKAPGEKRPGRPRKNIPDPNNRPRYSKKNFKSKYA